MIKCIIAGHITTQEERNDFIECVSNKTCEESQEYNEKYNKLGETFAYIGDINFNPYE